MKAYQTLGFIALTTAWGFGCTALTSMDDLKFDLDAAPDTDSDADSDSDSDSDSDTDTCSSNAYQQCHDGDVYWYDSCDELETLVEDCPDHFICEATSDTTAECVCADNWTGDDCDECTGNWDVATDCTECLSGWENPNDDNCSTCVRYVDAAATSGGDGLGWGTSFNTIQEAIFNAQQATEATGGPDSCEAWVKAGTYNPTEGGGDDATFLMISDVHVYGGFSDTNETWGSRDYTNNVTTMNGVGVYHVVTCANDSSLDGFTITGGDAWTTGVGDDLEGAGFRCVDAVFTLRNSRILNNLAHGDGAGALVTGASADVTFDNCHFSGNNAHSSGGGLQVDNGASASVIDCTFQNNENNASLGMGRGAGIGVSGGAGLVVNNSIFLSNNSVDRGAAIAGDGSVVEIYDTHFEGNHLGFGGSNNRGGAIGLNGGTLVVERSSFLSNYCENYARGGAISLASSATGTLVNSTFMDNYLDCSSDSFGGALYVSNSTADVMSCTFYDNWHDSFDEYGGAIYFDSSATGTITNCIIWGNDPDGVDGESFTYSDVQGGPWNPADHNLSENPVFIGGDPYDLSIDTASPCVDQGTSLGAPSTDMDGNPRPIGGGVDMGAFEVI
jgi:hypothetical protein